MTEKRLFQQLQRVATRYANFRFWSAMTVVWAVLALTAAILLTFRLELLWSGTSVVIGFLAIAMILTVSAMLFALRNRNNYLHLAQLVESKYPELEARLMTAIQQQPELPDGEFGFLQQQVIREALAHGRKQPWTKILSARRIAAVHLTHALTIICFIASMLIWAQVPPPPTVAALDHSSEKQATDSTTEYIVTVTPGDTEIEKGTSLLVTARFPTQVPGESTLVITQPDGSQQRVSMNRSLDDPLFGGHVNLVANDLTYQVEFADQVTSPFQVTVFEYPTLVRADAKLTFPGYTGMANKIVEDTHSISAVEGSKLQWICHLNKPVKQAHNM